MSTPVIENIAVNVYDAVNLITTGNGFNQTLTGYRPKRIDLSDITFKTGVVLIEQGDPEKLGAVNLATEWIQPFYLHVCILESDAIATTIDTAINKARSDIEKKLTEDVTRGGYAIDTEILAPTKWQAAEGYSGITVNVSAKYRTLSNDPYTQS